MRDLLLWISKRNKSICLVGLGPPDKFKRWVYYLLTDLLFFVRVIKKKVIYWIGTDVTKLRRGNGVVSRFCNIAGSPWLADEISGLGYEVDCCLFPVKIDANEDYPWPHAKQLTVLCYIPDQAHELHGSEEILHLVKDFPEVLFNIVGGTGAWCKDVFDNVIFHGWCDDVKSKIKESHVLLRRTKHDSFSAFVREGIVSDRYVIFTYDVPSVIFVKSGDYVGLRREFLRLSDLFKAGRLEKSDNFECIKMLDFDSQLCKFENIFKR